MIEYITKPPKPRTCKDTNEEYHEHPHMGSSSFATFHDSPFAFNLSREKPKKKTDAMEFGTLTHSAILEPELFNRDIVVIPNFGDLRSPANRERKKEWESSNTGMAIHKEDLEAINIARGNFWNNEYSEKMIDTIKEQSFYLTIKVRDRDYGFKTRPDAFDPDEMLADLKTINKIKSDYWMESLIKREYYDLRLAFIEYCLNHFGYHQEQFFIPFVENNFPYDTKWFEIPKEHIYKKIELVKQIMLSLDYCYQNEIWPGKQGNKLTMLFRNEEIKKGDT